MKKTITVILLSLLALVGKTQEVSNVNFFKQGNKVVIYYDLEEQLDAETYVSELWLSQKCDNNFRQLIKGVKGIGFVNPGYENFIEWTPTEDINYQNCCFKVKVIATLKAGTVADNTEPIIINSFTNYTETTAGLNLKMVAVKGGTFQMGTNDYDWCKPVHTVTVSDFYMGKYEVTNAEVCLFLNEKGNIEEGGTTWLEIESSNCNIEKKSSKFVPKSGYEKHPVVEFSWYGATAFCKWLSQKTGKTYRLPTEAEWEYAAGGGANNRTKWAGTDNENSLKEYAWFDENSYDLGSSHKNYGTNIVGTKKANQLGLHDMSGNVWEWCSDWYGSYSSEKQTNPKGASSGSERVSRGGSWNYYASGARASDRSLNGPLNRSGDLGFRLVFVP